MFPPGAPKGGRPPGARNKLSRKFLEDALASWLEHGPAALLEMREDDPSAYCRMMAAILPKEFVVEERGSGLSPELRERALELLRERLLQLEQDQQSQQRLLIEAKVEDGIAN